MSASETSVLHADGPNEHALCGLAFDAFDSGDSDQPVRFAVAKNHVGCEICLQMIHHVYSNFTKKGQVK